MVIFDNQSLHYFLAVLSLALILRVESLLTLLEILLFKVIL